MGLPGERLAGLLGFRFLWKTGEHDVSEWEGPSGRRSGAGCLAPSGRQCAADGVQGPSTAALTTRQRVSRHSGQPVGRRRASRLSPCLPALAENDGRPSSRR